MLTVTRWVILICEIEIIPKKKSRKKPVTPRSKVRAALTMLFLRSRERAVAIKRDKNTCTVCGIKATRAGKDETKWGLIYQKLEQLNQAYYTNKTYGEEVEKVHLGDLWRNIKNDFRTKRIIKIS